MSFILSNKNPVPIPSQSPPHPCYICPTHVCVCVCVWVCLCMCRSPTLQVDSLPVEPQRERQHNSFLFSQAPHYTEVYYRVNLSESPASVSPVDLSLDCASLAQWMTNSNHSNKYWLKNCVFVGRWISSWRDPYKGYVHHHPPELLINVKPRSRERYLCTRNNYRVIHPIY